MFSLAIPRHPFCGKLSSCSLLASLGKFDSLFFGSFSQVFGRQTFEIGQPRNVTEQYDRIVFQ
jgi:hypothetical protein